METINNPLEYSVIHEYQLFQENQPPGLVRSDYRTKPGGQTQKKGSDRLKSLFRNKDRSYWVQDAVASQCWGCQQPFSIWLRKHHCRRCCQVFCDNCSQYRIQIPDGLTNFVNQKAESGPVRVCQPCFQQIKIIQSLEKWIRIWYLIGPTLEILKKLSQVSICWYQVADYYWGKIRNIQYHTPNEPYTSLEKRLLWLNRSAWIGHSHYTLALLMSCDREEEHQVVVDPILSGEVRTSKGTEKTTCPVEDRTRHCSVGHQKLDCLTLLCTKYCCPKLLPFHMLPLIDRISRYGGDSPSISRLIIQVLSEADSDELSLHLPFFTNHLIHSRIDEPNSLANFLITRSSEDAELALEFYWNLNYYLKIRGDAHIYNFYIHRLLDQVNQASQKAIQGSHQLINLIQSIPEANNLFTVKQHFRDNSVTDLNLPFDGGVKTINFLYIHQIDIKNSATHPIYLPFNCQSNYQRTSDECEDCRVIYKTENVLQDYVVMKVIKLMNHLLKKLEGVDLDIVYYRVRPIDEQSGLIEIVPDCLTIYEIRSKKDYTIWNYIVDQNPHEQVETLRQKFIRTCATYCVLTYLLGVGDRHLDNIMITKDGRLFHIDYGFILGSDPKPISQPKIRITYDMIDALGGRNSPYFAKFTDLCNKLYQSLRPHLNLLIIYLSILSKNHQEHQRLVDVLTTRFNPGETAQAAIIKLETELHQSAQGLHVGTQLVDFFHYHNKEETLKNVWEQTFDIGHKMGNVMSTAWQVASQAVVGEGDDTEGDKSGVQTDNNKTLLTDISKKITQSWHSERRKYCFSTDSSEVNFLKLDTRMKGRILIQEDGYRNVLKSDSSSNGMVASASETNLCGIDITEDYCGNS